jgi:hypothetical protein
MTEIMKPIEENDTGFAPIAQYPVRTSDAYKRKVAECLNLLNNTHGYSRHQRAAKLEETMRTGEFPLLFADILDRELAWKYQDIGKPLAPIFRNKTVMDFRPSAWYRGFGARSRLSIVGELGQYPARRIDEARYTVQVLKYGNTIPISWETITNDDLGFFDDLAGDLAVSASNTDAWLMTSTMMDVNGPRAAVR